MVVSVSTEQRNRMAYTAALFWKAISLAGAGKVKTTWKYGTESWSRLSEQTFRVDKWSLCRG